MLGKGLEYRFYNQTLTNPIFEYFFGENRFNQPVSQKFKKLRSGDSLNYPLAYEKNKVSFANNLLLNQAYVAVSMCFKFRVKNMKSIIYNAV